VQCSTNISVRMPFPLSRCFKKDGCSLPLHPKKPAHIYLKLGDILKTVVLSTTSYIFVFLTDLCRITSLQPQKWFCACPKEHFSDEHQHFFQVTLSDLCRKTCTRLSLFFLSSAFCGKLSNA